jgi:hypothetical protein
VWRHGRVTIEEAALGSSRSCGHLGNNPQMDADFVVILNDTPDFA